MAARGSTGTIDGIVLAAIDRALDGGRGLDGALAELGRADPLLRSTARRRLREVVADASIATTLRNGRDGEAHVLRLASLFVTGTLPGRASRDDPDAMAAAYAEERAKRPRVGGVWWASAVALALAGALLVPLVLVLRSTAPTAETQQAPSASVSAEPEPPVAGAFADGGAPARSPGDAVVARALETDLAGYLIALDRRADARREGQPSRVAEAEAAMKSARAAALGDDVRAALPAPAFEAFSRLIDAAAASSAPDPGTGDDALARAAGRLDDELAAAGLGFFVDADLLEEPDGRRLVLVYAFRVVDVALFVSGSSTSEGRTVRALSLRRLDKLNWSHTLVGFTRPTLRYALVLLDQLDEQVITLLAPALAERAPMTLFEPAATAEERGSVEARAGEIVRAEYGTYPGLDVAAATKLGKLLGKRKALFDAWEKLATARGLTLTVPHTLRVTDGFVASLAGWVPKDEIAELRVVDAALDDRTRADAFDAIRAAFAASVAVHEVQHRLDALGSALPMPAELAARVGPLTDGAGKERKGAASARAELSAYLAELARDPRTPRVTLTLVARFLFNRRMHGTPESYAALSILEGLARATPGEVPPMLVSGKIDRRAVEKVWTALLALPPDALRAEARALWQRLFGAPLAELRQVAPATSAP